MKKKLLVGFGVLLIAIGAGFIIYRATRPSPAGSAEYASGELKVSVSYSRPSVRGRVIFGTEDQKALQPYGKYWRLGANRATEITFSHDVTFNGQAVSAGSYRMYAVPGADSFEIVLNSELGKSGSEAPNAALDVLHTQVPVSQPGEPVEQFTISMTGAQQGVDVVFAWSSARFVIPVRVR